MPDIIPLQDVMITQSNRAIATMFRDLGNIFDVSPPGVLDDMNVEVPYFTRNVDLSKVETLRGIGAPPQEFKPDFNFAKIKLKNHAIMVPIDKSELPLLYKIKSSSYSYIVDYIVEALMNSMHNSLKTELEDTNNYDGVAGEMNPAVQWSTLATATPRVDMNALKVLFRARQGAEPSSFLISRDVIDQLIATTDWINWWDKRAIPTTEKEQLEKYFSIDNVIEFDKYKGINGSFTNYYAKTAVLATVDPVGRGEVIGDIIANRSAIRFYFLDQNSPQVEYSEDARQRWSGQGLLNRLLIKIWSKWDQYGYSKNIHGTCDWNICVANKYGLARFTNVIA